MKRRTLWNTVDVVDVVDEVDVEHLRSRLHGHEADVAGVDSRRRQRNQRSPRQQVH